MTAEKMSLAEALDVAIASAENVWIVHGTFDETQCRQAAAALRRFREKGLPALLQERQILLALLKLLKEYRDLGGLTTEGE